MSIRWARRLATATAAATVTTLAVVGCGVTQVAGPIAAGGSPGSTIASEPPGFDATTHDFVIIRQVLAARAAAVLHHSQSAFMQTIDPDDTSFRSSEQTMYQNLQKLPVSSMSYESSEYGLTPSPVPGDDPTIAPQVTEHVELAGTDYAPVGIDVAMTFVRRNGQWYLGADGLSNDNAGFNATARPWDGPEIAVAKRGPLLVVADASPGGVAQHVLQVVSADLTRDAGILQIPVESRLLVDVTSGGSVTKFNDNEEAGGVTYPVDATRNDAAYRIAGWRIKINPEELPYLDSYPVLLRHELTHYLLRDFNGACPTWLSEGIAEYVSHQPLGLPSEQMTPSDYARLMRRPHVLINSGLYGDDPGTDYPLAMATVTYLVDNGGIQKVITLMKTYASLGGGADRDQLTPRALRTVYGMTPSQVANGAFALLAQLH